MPSGERIQFANNVNFIFECHSLQYASPATVSRCGMLLMSHQHNDIQNILAVWLSAQPTDQTGELITFLPNAQIQYAIGVYASLLTLILHDASLLSHCASCFDGSY